MVIAQYYHWIPKQPTLNDQGTLCFESKGGRLSFHDKRDMVIDVEAELAKRGIAAQAYWSASVTSPMLCVDIDKEFHKEIELEKKFRKW